MSKKCFKCKKIKPLSEYYKHKQMKDGHLNKCKECAKFDTKRNRIDNEEYYKEYDRKRGMLPHRVEARKAYARTASGIESISKTTQRYRAENPLKYRAHTAVGNAIRDGVLSKPEVCENCNRKSHYIHGHHDDYSKPLVVRWLCPKCHRGWHDKNGEALNG